MKLQKLLKKLALPVFALVVVSMLAACSSPSGGGSDSNGGGGGSGSDYTPPAVDPGTNYELSTDNMPDEVKEVLEKALEDAGIEASDSLTGAQIEEIKEALSEAGYTYTEKDGTITIIEKPAPSSGSVSPVSSDPLFEITDLTVTATKFEWTEGEWLIKFSEEITNGEKMFSEGKIKADASGIKWTEMKVTIKDGIIPDSATPEEIAQQEALGYEINGNKYSVTMVAGSKDIAKENETILEDFERYQTYQSFKTNAAKTKYYWEKISSKDIGTSTKKYYLEKKSGSSTPVILPESSNISFVGKFQGTVSGYTLGSYVTYNIYIESTNKADYEVVLYETGSESSPYLKEKGTIVSKDETSTRTEYQGKGTGHSLFITTYEEGEMEVSISLSSGLNYKGPITTPKSSEVNKPNTEADGSSGENSATGGSPQQGEEKIDMLEADSYKGKFDGYYSFWEGEDKFCFYIGEADLDKIIAYLNFSESDYDIDETEKKLVLTASGIEKFEKQIVTVYAGEGETSTAHSSSKDYNEKN